MDVKKKKRQSFTLNLLVFFVFILTQNLYSQSIAQEEANYWFQNGKYFLEKKHDYFSAYQCFKKAKELLGTNDEIEKYLRKTEKILQIPSTPTLLDKENSEKFTNQAIYYFKTLKKKEKAIQLLEKALLYNPQNKIAKEWLKKIEKEGKTTLKKIITLKKQTGLLEDFFDVILNDKIPLSKKVKFAQKNYSILKGKLPFLIIYLHLLGETSSNYETYLQKIKLILNDFKTISLKNKNWKILIKEELRCLYRRLTIEKAVFSYNDDLEILQKTNPNSQLLEKILKIEKTKLNFKLPEKMEILDLEKLKDNGYISPPFICPRKGIYYLSEGRILCSVHGLKNDKKILKIIAQNPYKDFLSLYFKIKNKKKKQIEIDEKIKSLDLARNFAQQGDLAFKQEKWKEALQNYQKAWETSNFEGYLLKIAETQFQLKEYKEALKNLKKFTTRIGDTQKSLELEGKIYLETNKVAEAVKTYRKLLKFKKDDPQFFMFVGDLEVKLNHIDLAIELYKKAAQKDKKNFLPLYKIGFLYLKSHEWEMAKKYFMRVMEKTDNPKINEKLTKIIKNLDLLIEQNKNYLH